MKDTLPKQLTIKLVNFGEQRVYVTNEDWPTKFSVRGYAVQANGIETVAAAWNSVEE